uniref:Transmembrane protein n=1 Tax=Ditylum brightwellii TaxID=49249 RepID=A0A6S9HDD2_9STRA|mmetsp:Transcript_25169/g.33392  ORF Transcript_25169/g.33392 Transcript_25169/m.33392 type:complete len:112 (-) Transcript_25169:243-578(-)
MLSSRNVLVIIAALCAVFVAPSNAFVVNSAVSTKARTASVPTAAFVFGKKKKEPEEDLSFIESRDMTREEMMELNAQNEEIMNMELSMMTGFSLVISLPILYLCWVAFFSD